MRGLSRTCFVVAATAWAILSIGGPAPTAWYVAAQEPPLRAVEKQPGKAKEDKLPPALTEYKGREIAPFMSYLGADWLIRESREREEACEKLLKILEVKPGAVLCDMGCGNGYYSIKLAKLVGEKGRVLGVDIQPEMLSLLKKRTAAAGVKNVEPILGTVIDPKLPRAGVDLI